MKPQVLFLGEDDDLLLQIRDEVALGEGLIPCQSLEELQHHVANTPHRAVIVHLARQTTGKLSAGRFMGELIEMVEAAPLYAVADTDCPPRLKKLAQRSADLTIDMPLDVSHLKSLLAQENDPAETLRGFWKDLPHKEMGGATRSMVTFAPEMFSTMEDLEVAAKHDVTVLLIGETGSGKTYLARLIHELSARANDRFCTVACGALPPDLIESELFGYVKGAFTGADANKEGKFAAAGTGTLLLDEIDVLPLEQQAKLLRVIETGEYEPVGSNITCHSQARLIVASNYELQDLVGAGTFRTDLYYRLNILNFQLPPLRDRPLDIEYLARRFAVEFSRTHGIPLREIDSELINALLSYTWPGNIRELENVIRRAVLYCQRGILSLSDLPSAIRNGAASGTTVATVRQDPRPIPSANGHASPAQPQPAGGGTIALDHSPNGQAVTLEARVDLVERRIIEDSLRRNHHRRKDTAAELGISRVTLYNKMKKFGLLN